jgi:hypothetical protein
VEIDSGDRISTFTRQAITRTVLSIRLLRPIVCAAAWPAVEAIVGLYKSRRCGSQAWPQILWEWYSLSKGITR